MSQTRITLTVGERTVVIEQLTTAQFLAFTAIQTFGAHAHTSTDKLLIDMSAVVGPFVSQTAADVMAWPIAQLCDVFGQLLAACKDDFTRMLDEQVTPAVNALTDRLKALAG